MVIPLGRSASISISPSIVFGSESVGFGLNVVATASLGNGFTVSAGYGVTRYRNAWGINKPMSEHRFVGAASFSQNGQQFTLGYTHFKGGSIDQNSLITTWSNGTFSASLDEDFMFGIPVGESDMYRTGAMRFTYKAGEDLELSAGFKIFTGDPDPDRDGNEKYTTDESSTKRGKKILDGRTRGPQWFNADGGEYRSGILYAGFNYRGMGYQGGWSSDKVRYVIQNKIVHGFLNWFKREKNELAYFPYIYYRPHYYFSIGAGNPFSLY
jgi:Bacterial toxin 23